MADSDTIRRLWLFKSDLEECPDDEKLIQILRKLIKLPVSVTSLQETGIGKVVNRFRKREGIAGHWVQKVVNTWKAAVEKEVERQEEEEERESVHEPQSPRLNGEYDSGDSDDRNSSSDDEKEENHGHLVNGKHSDNSDSDDKELDRARNIKQERLSSSGEDSTQEAGGSRGLHKSKDMDHLKTSSASEDDLTDSDLEEDADNGLKESYIESYYQKMLGQFDVKKENSDENKKSRGSGHREIKQSEKISNSSSSSKVKKDTDYNNRRSDGRKYDHGKKRYHDLSDSEEDEAVKMSHSGKHQSNCHGRPSLNPEEVHAKEKTLSQNGHLKHPPGDKHQKHSSSSSGEKHHKHSSSSSGEKHKRLSSSTGDKHEKHSSSSSGDKHKRSSSSGDKHQKHTSSSSGDRHQKDTSSSSGYKHQKHTSSSSGDKHQKHTSSSSGDKHQKHTSSSSGDKHQKHASSSSGDKHQKHTSSSSGEKQKQSSSSGEKHSVFSSSSSHEKHHKRSSSSSGERHHKHTSPSAGENLIKSSPKPVDRHSKSPSSSSSKAKVYKGSSPSTSDLKGLRPSSSSSSVEKSHKRLSSSSQASEPFSSSSSSSRNCSHIGNISAEGSEAENSLGPAYSPSLVSETIIKRESDEEEENEYVPSSKSTLPVEYVPTRKVESEQESGRDGDKSKYAQVVHPSFSDDCDSDRYSPTVGWKIKKEKVSDGHKYGGENHSLSRPSTSVSSPLSYVPTKDIKHEREDEDGENDSDEDMLSVPYIPTKKNEKDKGREKSSSTYIPTEKIKKEKGEQRSSSPSLYFPTKRIKNEKDDGRSSSPSAYIPTKKIKKEKGDDLPSKSTYIPSKKIKKEKDDERSPSPSPYIPTKQIKIEKGDNRSPSPYIPTKQIKIEKGDDRSPSPLIPSEKIKKEKSDKRWPTPSNCIPTTSIKQERDEDSPSYVPTKNIKKERDEENLSSSSSDWNDDSGSEGEEERPEMTSECHRSKKQDGGYDSKEIRGRSRHSPSSKREKYSSYKSEHHEYLPAKSESPQSDYDDVEMRYGGKSSSSSSHKHDKHYKSSDKHSKKSSSSSRSNKISSSSQRKSGVNDGGLVKEEIKSSSSDKVGNHKTDKTVTNYKEHSSHSKASSSRSSKTLSSSEKQCDKSRETHGSASTTSSVSSSSSKAKPSSSSNRDKKRKENLFSDACADLFSDTIQIKAEPSPPPPRQQEYKKQSSTKSKSVDVASKQTARSSSATAIKNEKAAVQKSRQGGETDENLSTDPADIVKNGPSPEKKRKIKESFHLDEGGMSFDDFLNFDEAATLKQKKSTSSKKSSKSSNKPSGTSSFSSTSYNRVSSSSANSMSSRDVFSLSVPTPPKTVSVTESDILSMLPETQAFYRPLRPNPMYDREEEPLEPVDADTITSKSYVRSKVYSGRKHVLKEVKSLYDSCLQVLMDNVDALDYVGGVPYSILKPVLERCSATQLYQLEDCNPHFIEDSDELWESHCHRDFRGTDPDEMESWRELYLRKLEEQEAKYQKLKASMSTVITKGQAGRHAKLAFVDTVAKPPRDVLRQQKRYGTGCVVMASKGGRVTKDSGSAVRTYKPSLTVPAHNPLSERPRMIKATPPMLAKALQMRKNMRR